MFWNFSHWIGAGVLCLALSAAVAQSRDDSVRVTVTVNPDGSKTVCQVDGAKQESVATTTDAKAGVGKIIYRLDDEGRYETGWFSGRTGTTFQDRLSIRCGRAADGKAASGERRHAPEQARLQLRRRRASNGLCGL